MGREKLPELNRATVKSSRKKRYSVVTDDNFIALMRAVGKPIERPGRAVRQARGEKLVGIFILPTNNVIEIIKDAAGDEKGILFNNIDTWMSFDLSDLEN